MRLLRPGHHLRAIRELCGLIARHRQLTWEMAKREIFERYAGQMLGCLWSIGHPLFLILIYAIFFSYVLGIRIGGSRELPLDYTTYLLSGLLPWMSFQESMMKGCGVIVANSNLVKQVVFPLEVLPFKGVIASLITQVIGISLLLVYTLIKTHSVTYHFAMVVPLLALQAMGMVGISFAFSAIGAYFRDLKDIVQVFCLAGMYLIPVCYLPQWVPGGVRPLLYLNPFSYLVWCYQDACYFRRFEHPFAWPVFAGLCLGAFYLGYRIFRKLKSQFGNVL